MWNKHLLLLIKYFVDSASQLYVNRPFWKLDVKFAFIWEDNSAHNQTYNQLE